MYLLIKGQLDSKTCISRTILKYFIRNSWVVRPPKSRAYFCFNVTSVISDFLKISKTSFKWFRDLSTNIIALWVLLTHLSVKNIFVKCCDGIFSCWEMCTHQQGHFHLLYNNSRGYSCQHCNSRAHKISFVLFPSTFWTLNAKRRNSSALALELHLFALSYRFIVDSWDLFIHILQGYIISIRANHWLLQMRQPWSVWVKSVIKNPEQNRNKLDNSCDVLYISRVFFSTQIMINSEKVIDIK